MGLFLLNISLFLFLFLLTVFWWSNVFFSLFYALPKSLILVIKGKAKLKVLTPYVVGPFIWIVSPVCLAFLLYFISPAINEFLLNSWGFLSGQFFGTISFFISLIGKQTRSDAKQEFEETIKPYLKTNT